MTNFINIEELRRKFQALTPSDRKQFIINSTTYQIKALYEMPELFLYDKQIPTSAYNWRYHLFMAGRGSGKTFAATSWLYSKILNGAQEVAIMGPDFATLIKEIQPTFESHFPPDKKPKYNGQYHYYKCYNGCIVKCYTSEQEVRGANNEYGITEEICKWCDGNEDKINERYNLFDLSVRIGKNPQIFNASTPKRLKWFLDFIEKVEKGNKLYSLTTGSTFDNIFLSEAAKEAYKNKFGYSREGKQELYAEINMDVDGALWTQEILDNTRAESMEILANPPTLHRRRFDNPIDWFQFFVIGVDPATTANPETSDAWGITVIGIGLDNQAYVIEDKSKVMTPNEAVEVIANLYRKYRCPKIVAESNQGGLMVEMIIRTTLPTVKPILIHANKSKMTRAQPISILFEQGRAHMVGRFEELEKELCRYTGEESQKSPNRLDSMVYAIQYALIEPVWNNTNSYDNLPKLG